MFLDEIARSIESFCANDKDNILSEEAGAIRFVQHLDYEYNVPTLGPLVKKVIYGIMVKNLNNIGIAIKERAEKS